MLYLHLNSIKVKVIAQFLMVKVIVNLNVSGGYVLQRKAQHSCEYDAGLFSCCVLPHCLSHIYS